MTAKGRKRTLNGILLDALYTCLSKWPPNNHEQITTLQNVLVAGLPRARSARGTEPHTHGIWSTSFRLVVT